MSKNTDAMIARLQQREERGLSKYGTTLDRTDMEPGEWIQHAQDEALDLAAYLEGLKQHRFPCMEQLVELVAIVKRMRCAQIVGSLRPHPDLRWQDIEKVLASQKAVDEWLADYDARDEVRHFEAGVRDLEDGRRISADDLELELNIGPQLAAPKSIAAIKAEVQQARVISQSEVTK